jgi:quercetin dioxygenase-like cupin family protein
MVRDVDFDPLVLPSPLEEDSGALLSGGKISKGRRKTMKRGMRTGLGLVLTTIAPGVSPGLAQDAEQVKPPTGAASSFDFGGVNVFEHAIPNAAGKSLVAILVTYPPGGKSPPHHHAPSAFIYGYVLSGAVRSQVDDGPVKVYQTGEGFYEMPGARHRISENASDKSPASLLAVYVVDSNDKPLTTPDQK